MKAFSLDGVPLNYKSVLLVVCNGVTASLIHRGVAVLYAKSGWHMLIHAGLWPVVYTVGMILHLPRNTVVYGKSELVAIFRPETDPHKCW